MSHQHFDRHTCSCHSSHSVHHTHCNCRVKHHDRHNDSCMCRRDDGFPRHHFRRRDDLMECARINRNNISQSFSPLTPLNHKRRHEHRLIHSHHNHHSNSETIQVRTDDGKKNIVIIF